MTLLKKLWISFIAASLLLLMPGGTPAFASETDTDALVIDGGTTDDTMDLLLQEGYYLDEQGQLCYEEPASEVEESGTEDTAPEDNDTVEEQEDTPDYSEEDLRLLSCVVYSEAGNQSYDGMLAVANVVLNRVRSAVYSHVNTIKEVIYDKKWTVQFAVTIKNKKTGLSRMDQALKLYDTRNYTGSNPKAQENAMNKAIKAAKAALGGKNNIGHYLCFQNKRSASRIKKKYSDVKILGDHIFYRIE